MNQKTHLCGSFKAQVPTRPVNLKRRTFKFDGLESQTLAGLQPVHALDDRLQAKRGIKLLSFGAGGDSAQRFSIPILSGTNFSQQ